jgi:holo-[acyl-carrier protein] synthase
MLRTGVDFIEVARIDEAILRHGDRFFDRFYTPQELIDAGGRTPALAGRFAAKEAVAKALGSGIGEVGWKDIEILKRPGGEPALRLHGAARLRAEALGLGEWSVTISHTHQHAVAFVVAATTGNSSANLLDSGAQ